MSVIPKFLAISWTVFPSNLIRKIAFAVSMMAGDGAVDGMVFPFQERGMEERELDSKGK
jgi:hypothetical protein